MYPAELTSPYLDRFSAAAAQRYKALGIRRDDPDRPMKIAAVNSDAFGAPVVLFCYLDRTMGWTVGTRTYLKTVMLLLRAGVQLPPGDVDDVPRDGQQGGRRR